jgi:predicted enzyme related to lactoylglutathione lyase
MTSAFSNPVVHLELHTGNLPRACAFYTRLFGWPVERVDVGRGSYLALGLGDGIEGGVVERETERALWLPYVEVADVAEATNDARRLGASVLLEPREGPAGWRSVVSAPAGAEIALWQPKAPARPTTP